MDAFKKVYPRSWCCGACDRRSRKKPTQRKIDGRIARARLKRQDMAV